MENLKLQVIESDSINLSLQISDERRDQISEVLESVFTESAEAEDRMRITSLAQRAADRLGELTANELFFLGLQIGQVIERHHMMQMQTQPTEEQLQAMLMQAGLGGTQIGEA